MSRRERMERGFGLPAPRAHMSEGRGIRRWGLRPSSGGSSREGPRPEHSPQGKDVGRKPASFRGSAFASTPTFPPGANSVGKTLRASLVRRLLMRLRADGYRSDRPCGATTRSRNYTSIRSPGFAPGRSARPSQSRSSRKSADVCAVLSPPRPKEGEVAASLFASRRRGSCRAHQEPLRLYVFASEPPPTTWGGSRSRRLGGAAPTFGTQKEGPPTSRWTAPVFENLSAA